MGRVQTKRFPWQLETYSKYDLPGNLTGALAREGIAR